MRLIDVKSLLVDSWHPRLTSFEEPEEVRYAILSHRWQEDEVTFQDVSHPSGISLKNHMKSGYQKIIHAARTAKRYTYDWLWVDTCCIDKTNNAELSESLNSMFRWYQRSHLCIAYLYDYPSPECDTFTKSEWFDRAWTFQELVAPSKLIFFDRNWNASFEGYKSGRRQEMAEAISTRTCIDVKVLHDSSSIGKSSLAQRLSWAAGRRARKVEDIAYCLIGICDVNMPLLYGERQRAFLRLQEEIMQRNADQTVFCFKSDNDGELLARCPDDFADSSAYSMVHNARKPFSLNNIGLEIELELSTIGLNTYIAALDVVDSGQPGSLAYLLIEINGGGPDFYRVGILTRRHHHNDMETFTTRQQRITVARHPYRKRQRALSLLYGFRLASDCLPLTVVNYWDPVGEWDRGSWGRWRTRRSMKSVAPPEERLNSGKYLKREPWCETGPIFTSYKKDDIAPPSFVIPNESIATVAMMELELDEQNKYQIQFAFDFEYCPTCLFSRVSDFDYSSRFHRGPSTLPGEDGRFTWIFKELD